MAKFSSRSISWVKGVLLALAPDHDHLGHTYVDIWDLIMPRHHPYASFKFCQEREGGSTVENWTSCPFSRLSTDG